MQQQLARCQAAVSSCFETVLFSYGSASVEEATRYALNGGKRIRAFLVMESAALFDISTDVSIWPAAAIEALHAYSLVHDDLPAMDNDALRRGQPTVHVKWDDATAILVGDALQSLAFDLLSEERFEASDPAKLALISGLSRQAGLSGMVLGQAQDIAAETAKTPLSFEEIVKLQALKTGALIEWSATAGAILAGENPDPLQRYASAIGLAFQIKDDILDVEGEASKTGKAVGKDHAAGKATFVSHLGLDGAKARASELTEEAIDALSPYGAKADSLRDLARFIITRDM